MYSRGGRTHTIAALSLIHTSIPDRGWNCNHGGDRPPGVDQSFLQV
jgi:hypothetical protein